MQLEAIIFAVMHLCSGKKAISILTTVATVFTTIVCVTTWSFY
jgi:hypothetical protein